MNWIKDIAVSLRLKQMEKGKEKRNVSFPTQPKCVAVLADEKEEFEYCKEVIRKKWGYHVRILGGYFTDEKQDIDGFNQEQFTLWGNPSEYFNELLDQKLDFILTPSLELNAYLRYLLLASKSSFNLGFHSENNMSILDLMIKKEGVDLKANLKRLMDYFDKIKTT